MSMFNHKHNTRLKTGALKRKCIVEELSDFSCNDSSSSSDDNDRESDMDDTLLYQKNKLIFLIKFSHQLKNL